jgi:hypothetical protein
MVARLMPAAQKGFFRDTKSTQKNQGISCCTFFLIRPEQTGRREQRRKGALGHKTLVNRSNCRVHGSNCIADSDVVAGEPSFFFTTTPEC